jgi:hypothetical protein
MPSAALSPGVAPRFCYFVDEQPVRSAPWLASHEAATLYQFKQLRLALFALRCARHGSAAEVHVRLDSDTGRVGFTPRGPCCAAFADLVADIAYARMGMPTDPP